MRMQSLAVAMMGALLTAGGAAAQQGHGEHEAHEETAAAVDGNWDLDFRAPWGEVEMRLDLTQTDKRLRGFALWGPRRVMIDRGRVDGEDVSFVIVAGDGVTHSIDMLFEGRIEDDEISGRVSGWDGAPAAWTARRIGS